MSDYSGEKYLVVWWFQRDYRDWYPDFEYFETREAAEDMRASLILDGDASEIEVFFLQHIPVCEEIQAKVEERKRAFKERELQKKKEAEELHKQLELEQLAYLKKKYE